jgi:hypothetical protein
MSASHLIDVGVGIVLLYALTSVVASSLLELVASVLAWRAKDLKDAIRILLGNEKTWDAAAAVEWFFRGGGFARKKEATTKPDPDRELLASTTKAVLGHPFIGGALPTHRDAPSYVASRDFALAVFDVITEGAPTTFTAISNAVRHPGKVPEPLRRALQPLIDTADSLEDARANVSLWFDGTMDRLSGLYKRRTQLWLILFGLALASALNLDTFSTARRLAADSAVAGAVAQAAQQDYVDWRQATARPTSPEAAVKATTDRWDELAKSIGKVSGAGFTVGWSAEAWPKKTEETSWWIAKVFGILVTGLATSVGASTWFAALGKLLALRSAVQPSKEPS